MSDIISLAKERADAFGVRNVIIASIAEGANLVCDTFGTTTYRVIALGNTPQTDEERRAIAALEERGAEVLLIERTLFQALSHGKAYTIGGKDHTFAGDYFGGVGLNEVIEKAGKDPRYGAIHILYQTIQQLFSDGPRMCIEIALAAADAGVLPTDQDCVSIDRPLPQSGCPHAAMVLRPSRTEDLLKWSSFRVKDLVMVPGPRDQWFKGGHIWSEG